jgi:hypothetical protein
MFTTSTSARERGWLPEQGEVHETARGVVNATLIGALIWTLVIGAWLFSA